MTNADESGLLRLFEELVPPERWQDVEGAKGEPQIYTLPVVVWMMLFQRLNERGSQQEAVHQIAAGRLAQLMPQSKRVREDRISDATGGYARACARTSVEALEKVADEALRKLGERIDPQPQFARPVLLVDGTTVSLEHEEELLKAFPPGSNQHGAGHWGVLKMVALHDVQTGIALRPAWGPMYGPEAVSEQALAKKVIQQSPTNSVILGDGNFGIFWFVHEVAQSQREGIFRLTAQRARSLGAKGWQRTGEKQICWRPSRKDLEKHPELARDAKVQGRLIFATVNGFRPLYLFTTLDESYTAEQVVALYAKRWHLELDLRTLKRTMRLHHLRTRSRAAIEKELLIAIVAYGLVRAFMAVAARRAGVQPRELSFTRAYGLLNAMMWQMCSAVPEQREQSFQRILRHIEKAKLPKRSKQRSYPREVWGFRQAFPRKKSK